LLVNRAGQDNAHVGKRTGREVGVGADAIDPRLELAIVCVFATCVNLWRWLAALDDFRNWLIREAA